MFPHANFFTESESMLKIRSMFVVDTNKTTTEHSLEEECSELGNEGKVTEEKESKNKWQQAI